MIPKIIHYCWFGGKPLPEYAKKCIASWKKYCPDFKILEWNEANFDVNSNKYCSEAYKAKKYAFVSDYARFVILYKYGGCYFDTDVEIIKPLNHILSKGPFFGCENWAIEGKVACKLRVAPGLGMACGPGNKFYKQMLDIYETLSFYNTDGSLNMETIVSYTTDILREKGLKDVDEIQCIDGIYIYPKDFFCPIDHVNNLILTDNTVSIHNYAGSWLPESQKLKTRIIKLLGARVWNLVLKLRGLK